MDVIIAAAVCQKKLECLQLFSAAGRKQLQGKHKHTVTHIKIHGEKPHRSVHRSVCSHSDKEDARGNEQKMCLQVGNVTKEAEHMEAEHKVGFCRAEVMAAASLFQG